jgi:hypothetical protein
VELGSAVWLAWSHRMPALPTALAEPPKGEATVMVLGESSARGFPYHDLLSIGEIVAWQLERSLPGLKVQADNRGAQLGATLERVHQVLEGLTQRPDVLIVYSGHNEIQSRIENTRGIYLNEAPSNPLLYAIYRASRVSPFCHLVYETVSRNRLGGPPSPLREHHLIDVPAYTPSEFDALVSDFRRRLESIVSYCERIGCVPVLVIPPANEGGFEPNRSVLEPTATASERSRVEREFAASRSLEGPDPRGALAGYRAILGRHPGFAEAQFRAARVLEGLGEYGEASRHYVAALDSDAYPVRCPGPFQEAYRAVARRHGCVLVDGPAVLRGICPRGILEDHAINDAHHPALVGHAALAEAVLRGLHGRGALGWRGGDEPTVDAAEVAAHFGIGPEEWVVACARSATLYRDFSWARYDRTERLAKQALYEEAGRRIARGIPPEQAGVPGIGVPPVAGH